ncbi:MAG: acyltransferase family protein [Flavobacteriales bacterium]
MKKSENSHLTVIYSIRGIGALAVCLYHFTVFPGMVSSSTLLSIFHFAQKAVHVFFILSGVVVPLSMINSNYKLSKIGKYLWRRIVRLEIPFLVSLLMGFAFLHLKQLDLFSFAENPTPGGRDLLLNVSYLVPFFPDGRWINPVFWTLSIEFQFYLVIALTLPLALSKNLLLRMCFIALLLSTNFLIPYHTFFFGWAAFIGLGVVYALYRTKKWNTSESVIAAVLLSTTILFHQNFLDLIIAIFTLGLVHFWPYFKNPIGQFFGKISYSLYLIHSIVGVGFLQFTADKVSSPTGKFMLILAALILSLVAAYALWKWVENPSKKAARKIKL